MSSRSTRHRTFLRLEFLYTQASTHSESPSPWSRCRRSPVCSKSSHHRHAATRGSDVLKELERQVTPEGGSNARRVLIPARRKSLMSNAGHRAQTICRRSGGGNYMERCGFGHSERGETSSAIPGGTLRTSDLPDYSDWLNRPAASRALKFDSWLSVIRAASGQHSLNCCGSLAQNAKRTRSGWAESSAAVRSREPLSDGAHQHLPSDTDRFPEISGNQDTVAPFAF